MKRNSSWSFGLKENTAMDDGQRLTGCLITGALAEIINMSWLVGDCIIVQLQPRPER